MLHCVYERSPSALPWSHLTIPTHFATRFGGFRCFWMVLPFYLRKSFLFATLLQSPDMWRICKIAVTCMEWLVLGRYSCGSFNVAVGPLAASRTNLLSFCQFWRDVLYLVTSLSCPIFSTCWRRLSRCSKVQLTFWKFVYTPVLIDTFPQWDPSNAPAALSHGFSDRMKPRCEEHPTETADLYLEFIRMTISVTGAWSLPLNVCTVPCPVLKRL